MKVRVLKIETINGKEVSRVMQFQKQDWDVIRKMKMDCRWELLPSLKQIVVEKPLPKIDEIQDSEIITNFVSNENNGRNEDLRSIESEVGRTEQTPRAKRKPKTTRKSNRTKSGASKKG